MASVTGPTRALHRFGRSAPVLAAPRALSRGGGGSPCEPKRRRAPGPNTAGPEPSPANGSGTSCRAVPEASQGESRHPGERQPRTEAQDPQNRGAVKRSRCGSAARRLRHTVTSLRSKRGGGKKSANSG